MLFAHRYRSHFHLTEAQYEEESEDAKWLARTIWTLEGRKATLNGRKRQQ